jgi:hypothetical protein
MGYQQQTGYPEKLPQIAAALRQYLSANGGIDFILHGGDMLDCTTDDNIRAAAEHFDFAIPVYLCLGNHDVTVPDAVERWLALAPQFFVGGVQDYTVASEACLVHVVPNHWCDRPSYWNGTQNPHLSDAQAGRLANELDRHLDIPHILLTHCPVYGLPIAQTGFRDPYHAPSASFTRDVVMLATTHGSVKCVLGAHNHMNMRVRHAGVEFATVSALVETPFEFKLFEVTPQKMAMQTISLRTSVDFDAEPDPAKSFVQGRNEDRSFSREFMTT